MPKAFISGCAGLALSPDERAFLSEADPWGLILFKRNVADRDQLRALTAKLPRLRRAAGRAGADRSGGRARPADGAAALAGLPGRRADRRRVRARGCGRPRRGSIGRLIAHDLHEVGITIDCAPVLDVAEPGDACGHRRARLVRGPRPRRRARPRLRGGAARGRRRAGRQAHARPRPGARRQPSRVAGGRGLARGARARFRAVPRACRPADGDDRPCRLSRARPRPSRDRIAHCCRRDHARRNRL